MSADAACPTLTTWAVGVEVFAAPRVTVFVVDVPRKRRVAVGRWVLRRRVGRWWWERR